MFGVTIINTETGSCGCYTVATIEAARREAAYAQGLGRVVVIRDRRTGCATA